MTAEVAVQGVQHAAPLFILMTEVDGGLSDFSLHGSRADAELALFELTRSEWSDREGAENSSPATIQDCIRFLLQIDYVDVRLVRVYLGAGPGELIHLDPFEI